MKSPRRPNPLCPARLTPLALAVAGLAGAAGAAPFTGVQTTDNVQISQQGQTTTLTQTAPVGIVRTEGFGIGATEAVRALQPTAQSTLWIDVTGAARSDILGSLTANGRVLISNPYGIYFGAGAQINVGALVATTLTPQAEGIAQGRILLKDSGVPGGRVVNAGTLKADGTVALVAPQVVNEGVIEAHRVGLAAASEVLVDVEGDGLVFFQLGGAQVAQRLDQLGRITSDGGTVDLRANARAAMADTVLNLDGVVQARSLGQRGGVVYVDGGAQGRTEVKGAVDVSGLDSGERGGRVDITGQQLSVAASARIDARGDAGGGTVHLGGGWQGTGSLAHANRVDVAQGAQIDASAVTLGDGGEVVVWSQGVTRFQGLARARGGAQGGDGGRVEVSGAQLGFQGQVDTAAPLGRTGSLLLDPTDLTVLKVNGQLGANEVDVATLNASTTSVTLQADNSITVQDNIHMTQPGAGLTLNGGASIVLKANILIDDGALSLTATTISLSGKVGQVSDFSLSAKGGVSLLGALTGGGQNLTIDSAGAKSLAAVSGVLNLASTGAGATTLNGDVATSGTQNYGAVTLGNDVTLTSSGAGAAGAITVGGALTGAGKGLTLDSAGAKSLAAVSGVLNLASTGAGVTTLNGNVATTGTQNYGAVTLGNDVTLTSSGTGAAGAITVGGALTGAGKGLTLDSAGAKSLAAVSGVLNLASTGAGVTTLNGNVATTGTQNYGAVTLGNDVTLTSSGTGAAGDITLAGAIAGAGKDLTVQTVGTTAFNANVDGVRNLVTDAGGTTRLAADVRTSGSQTYNDALVVAGTGPRTLEASSIELLGTSLDAGGRDLVLRTDALSTSASLSVANATGRAVTVETRSDGVDILLNHAGTGLSLSTGTLTALRAFASVTLGRGSSASQITAGAFTLPAQLALLSSTGDVTLAGAVTGAGGALRIATAGRAVISGGLSGAASLDVNAGQGTTVSADVATTGSQTYAQRLTLNGGDRVLRAGAFTVQGEFDVAHNNVRIDTDRLDLRGLVRNGSGATLFLASLTPGLGIQLADADPLGGGITPSPLYLSQALLNLVADFSSVHIGRAGFTGAVNAVNLSLPADMVLEGSSVSLSGTTLGQVHRLGLNASTGVTTLQGSLTGVTDLHTDAGGGTEVSGRVAVTGELHFGDAVQLATGAAVTLEADRLTLDQGLNTRGTDLNLRVNAWSVAGGLTHAGIAGRLSIATLSDGRDICLNTSVGCGTALVLDGGLLSQWNVFSSATVGRADSDSAIRANALTLPTDLTLRSGAGDIALAGTTSGAAHLSLDTAGTATLGPVSVQSLSTSVRGTTALGGDVSTVGAQAYGNAVRLNADVQLSAGGVALGATLDANGHDLTVRADAFSLAGSTSGGAGRTVTVSPRTIGGDLWVGLAGPGLSISGIDLARLGGPSGFSEVRLGRIDNAGAVWVEGLALPTDVRLTGTSVVFMGTTALNGYRLDVRTDDFLLIDAFAPGAGELVLSPLFTSGIHLNDGTFTGLFLDQPTLGHLAGIGRLTLGRTDLGTTVTVGQFGTSTTLSSNLRLVGSDVTFVGDLHMNGRALDLWADRLNGLAAPGAGPTVSGLGAVNLASRTAGASIGLASGTGTVRFSQSTVDAFADATVLTVGRAGSDSTVQAAGLTLRTGTVIDAGLGDITFNGTTVGSGKALQLNSGGVTTLGGSIGGLASLATDAPGTTLIGQDVGTSGAQTYLDNATLVNSAAAATFTASALTFGQDLDVNQRDLVVRADSFQVNGATRNADRANLQLTSRTAGRDIFLNTSGTGLTLDNTTLQALALFRTLTIGSSDSGAIAAHDLSLPADLTLISGSHITFTGATVGGGHRLSLRAPGDTLLQGSYSGLLSLSTDAPGSTRLATDVQASESVTVLDRLVLEGAATRKLSADSVALQGGLDATAGLAGATGEALVVHANAFAAAGTTTGASGKRLTVATLTDGAAIAVNVPGGSGLQLSAATLGALSGFNTITLGRSDSNSAIAVQNITLPAHLVLEAGAADVTVSGTVQGAGWGLSVRSAGLTTLAGSLLGLGSIDTDAGGSTEIATDVNTSGAQTYRDAVSLTGPAGGVRGLRASELAFLDGLAVGDRDLALRTDALTLSGVSVSGGHTLTLSAMTAGRDILLNRAGAGLSLDAAALARLSVFSGVTVGGSDADGAILADNLTLPTAMTLRTRFGEIALSGTTDAQSWALTVQTFANVTVSGSLVRLPRLDLSAATLRLETATGLTLGNLTLSAGDSVVRSAGVLTLAGDIVLNGGSLLLRSDVTPTVLSTFTSPEHAGQFRTVGVSTVLAQASNGIVQSAGRIVTAAGSHLALRTTAGASIDVGGAANELGGTVSAVSGDIAENLGTPRLTTPGPDGKVVAGFLNLRANQLNVAGRPVDNSDQALLRAGLEADVVALQADRIQTATHNGLIRARLPYDNNQGTLTAMPALTLTVSASGLGGGASYGGIELGQRIAVSIGGSAGGYVTVRPRRGISLGSGYVSLGGEEALRPFYDGNGDLSAVPLFYNGLAPQSAQAVGALSAVTAVIEEARRARFEEAVRTENVASRLRTGVIAEVGAGRPATEGSDTLALPQACTPAGESLRCE